MRSTLSIVVVLALASCSHPTQVRTAEPKPQAAKAPEQPPAKPVPRELSPQELAQMPRTGTLFAVMQDLGSHIQISTLENGARVIWVNKPQPEQKVNILISLRIGDEQRLAGNWAKALLIPPWILMATQGLNSAQFSQVVRENRLQVSAQGPLSRLTAEPDRPTFKIETTEATLISSLELLGKMLRSPELSDQGFASILGSTKKLLQHYLTDASTQGIMLAQRFGALDSSKIPNLSRQIQELADAKPDAVRALYRELWGAGFATIAIYGNASDPALLAETLEKVFGTWRAEKESKPIVRYGVSGKNPPKVVASDTVWKDPSKEAFVGSVTLLPVDFTSQKYAALEFATTRWLAGIASRILATKLANIEALIGGVDAVASDVAQVFWGIRCNAKTALPLSQAVEKIPLTLEAVSPVDLLSLKEDSAAEDLQVWQHPAKSLEQLVSMYEKNRTLQDFVNAAKWRAALSVEDVSAADQQLAKQGFTRLWHAPGQPSTP